MLFGQDQVATDSPDLDRWRWHKKSTRSFKLEGMQAKVSFPSLERQDMFCCILIDLLFLGYFCHPFIRWI
jgi:hypothetical protein